ncbi:hypothetical protein EKD00_00860 [Chlorobium phaeovibrioides]|uniref:Uncharacterized protein n=2 Tax=Chlorobium/Pelodictyon group TaxID=274493 RepID=A0A165LTI8_PELLU|nr:MULTISPECIES: hypothetical protein [Chlorobium/Pelodictyon group]KZK74411.1 MAG: hypothetical protein A3K90_03950 [Pelodictyon luteolum]MWV55208.1 hypothetical protein [Chlorobium phaeovibrioides]NQU45826.1 hypothetical protein [Chlorobium sp.]RTY37310.1 hypothetical protein EKD00_00860 [Chlorobium phaeovibrioides]
MKKILLLPLLCLTGSILSYSTVRADPNIQFDNTNASSPVSIPGGLAAASDNSSAYIVQGNYVMATVTAKQYNYFPDGLSVTSSNTSSSSTTSSAESGGSIGSATVNFNNSATALAIGGNY